MLPGCTMPPTTNASPLVRTCGPGAGLALAASDIKASGLRTGVCGAARVLRAPPAAWHGAKGRGAAGAAGRGAPQVNLVKTLAVAMFAALLLTAGLATAAEPLLPFESLARAQQPPPLGQVCNTLAGIIDWLNQDVLDWFC